MNTKFLKAPRGAGVEVPHNKHTDDCESVRLPLPAQVTVQLSQHIGAPAVACVAKGDRVMVGTVLAKAGGFVSADTHSPVSGTVKELTTVLTSAGAAASAVVIDVDGAQEVDPAIVPPVVTDAASLVSAIQHSGLVGLGGAGFPTHVKLSLSEDKPHPDFLLINGAECEPYITSDFRGMMEEPDDIIEGIQTVLKYLDIPKCIIGIENNKPRAIELLKQKTAEFANIEIRVLKSSYPQGAEKVLIATLTGRAVPMGGLPIDAGCVILNIGTVAFIAKYLRTGMPLIEKRITLDGKAIAKPGNYIVPIGMSIKDVVDAAGGYACEPAMLLMGGMMMGIAQYTDETPILKNNNAILALTEDEIGAIPDNPCIHCGRCVEHCPMRLSPVEIAFALSQGDDAKLAKLSVNNCIECGSCSFICPAGRPLTQQMRLAKAQLRKAGTKK